MDTIKITSPNKIGYGFIPPEYIPKGKDEFYLRNIQLNTSDSLWRHVSSSEIDLLVKNNNYSENWNDIWVTEGFNPELIKNSEFFGKVRIGSLSDKILVHNDFRLKIGIYNSRIISCDIGKNPAIHNVRYLSFFIIEEQCILSNIDEMITTNCAKFGNGIIKEGESEENHLWMEIINETGCRSVIPFDGMLPADAYIWSKYRDDTTLQKKLIKITQNQCGSERGYYGIIGSQSIIKNCRNIKDVKIGPHCYIHGSNILENLTINSDKKEPTEIGEGSELVNGIISTGCNVFYDCKAIRFIMGRHSNLKYGARLFDTFLGDNSTISCCEVLNNLIYPAHEQHHNNSFLIASIVKGQSNIAAGATIGSNHNSRANDNEIEAGRGFWPGLCTSLKHPSKFASFTLLAKANYPAELNILLPFALVNNNVHKDRLEVLPAFWWLYNMYALSRNSWKFKSRDKRINKKQHIEFDAIAPDTIEEILHACTLLEIWAGKAVLRFQKEDIEQYNTDSLIKIGRDAFYSENDNIFNEITVYGEDMEKSNRNTVIIKPRKAYTAYGDMLCYYSVKNIMDFLFKHPNKQFQDVKPELYSKEEYNWINIGGQIIQESDMDQLRSDIRNEHLTSWPDVHARYNQLWENYPKVKQKHAFSILCTILNTSSPDKNQWLTLLERAYSIQVYIRDQVYASRKKDFDNPFRKITYRNEDEMAAAVGTINDNSFIKQVQKETENFKNSINLIKKREQGN